MREKQVEGSASSLSPSFLITGALLALTLTRWFLPTEATEAGETLWIAGLWFLFGLLICIKPRSTDADRKFDLADLAVTLFIGGHVLSGIMVVSTSGDQRAAWNCLWEWLSLGVMWFAWRARLDSELVRRAWLPMLLVTALTLSCWGLWQYFVWYPQIRHEYAPLIEQVQQLEAKGQNASGLKLKLSDAGIPTEGPELQLFLNRIRDSREPFGPFGLANTLGGFLAVGLVLTLGSCMQLGSNVDRTFIRASTAVAKEQRGGTSQIKYTQPTWLGLLVVLLPILACLYLTNSRTAWGGTLVAAGMAGVLWFSRHTTITLVRRGLFPCAVGCGVLAGCGLLLWITRGEHGLPGPLKSLAYRAEYWIGTWRMLGKSPVFGIGLGQFRDHFLPFRLPVTSEEISDPHNLLLDVWANGGLLALGGLIGLIALVLLRLWTHAANVTENNTGGDIQTAKPGIRAWGLCGLAFPLVILGQWISTGVWDSHSDTLFFIALLWAGLAAGLWWWLDKRETAQWVSLLAALALTTHLLGAGGIGMPAVTQLWLLLIACGLPQPARTSSWNRNGLRWLAGGGCLLMLFGWFITGWWPTTQSQDWIARGDAIYAQRGDLNQALHMYQRAAEVDRWNPEPYQRLAESEFRRVTSSGKTATSVDWDTILNDQNAVIARCPHRYGGYLRKAQMLATRARSQPSNPAWEECLATYAEAERRHPTHVQILLESALALGDAGQKVAAEAMAKKTLAQNEINRERRHWERILAPADVEKLKRLGSLETFPE